MKKPLTRVWVARWISSSSAALCPFSSRGGFQDVEPSAFKYTFHSGLILPCIDTHGCLQLRACVSLTTPDFALRKHKLAAILGNKQTFEATPIVFRLVDWPKQDLSLNVRYFLSQSRKRTVWIAFDAVTVAKMSLSFLPSSVYLEAQKNNMEGKAGRVSSSLCLHLALLIRPSFRKVDQPNEQCDPSFILSFILISQFILVSRGNVISYIPAELTD